MRARVGAIALAAVVPWALVGCSHENDDKGGESVRVCPVTPEQLAALGIPTQQPPDDTEAFAASYFIDCAPRRTRGTGSDSSACPDVPDEGGMVSVTCVDDGS